MPAIRTSEFSQSHNHISFDKSRVCKRSSRFRIEREAKALAFVKSRTEIPVPTVYGVELCDDGESSITMSRSLGKTLESAWTSMTDQARTNVLSQLKKYLIQLRLVSVPNPGYIGGVDGEKVYDHRLNNGFPCGPFSSIAEFHDYLTAPVRRCPKPELESKYREKLSDEIGTVFTHADLSSENILVDPESGSVTAIIDWEMAGWWPEWWESRKALAGSRNMGWWPGVVEKILFIYQKEWAIDTELECFG